MVKKTYDVGYQAYEKLINCKDNNEAGLLIAYLELNDIRATTKYSSSGSYLNILHGYNYQGVDILVPKEQYEAANKVLQEFKDSEVHIELGEDEKDYNNRKRFIARLLVGVGIIIPMIILIVVNLLDIF